MPDNTAFSVILETNGKLLTGLKKSKTTNQDPAFLMKEIHDQLSIYQVPCNILPF